MSARLYAFPAHRRIGEIRKACRAFAGAISPSHAEGTIQRNVTYYEQRLRCVGVDPVTARLEAHAFRRAVVDSLNGEPIPSEPAAS